MDDEEETLKHRLVELQKLKHVHDDHIHLLHKYNDIKDVAQTLIGKLSEIEGISVKEMHNRFDLDMED